MHALQAMVVVAVLAVGLGAKLIVFPTTEAEVKRDAIRTASSNVPQMNLTSPIPSGLPVERIYDMTFVDPEKN